MGDPTFTIVYQKLQQALAEPGSRLGDTSPIEAKREEIDEIDRLRRMVLEVTEIEPTSFTTT